MTPSDDILAAVKLLTAALAEEESEPRLRSSLHARRANEVLSCLPKMPPLDRNIPPIIIAGLQRTGSTLLHVLLSKHSKLIAAPFYRLSSVCTSHSEEQSRKLAERTLAAMYEKVPELRYLHGMTSDDPEECCHLLIHAGVDRNAVLVAQHMQAYFDWLITLPKCPALATELLSVLSCLTRAAMPREGIPVLKDVLHMLFLEQDLVVFPDCVIVHTFRRPEEVLLSACECYAALARFYWTVVDMDLKHEIGSRIVRLFTACLDTFCDVVERRKLLRSGRLIAVPYSSLLADPLGVVKLICAARNIPLSAADVEAIAQRAKQPHQGRPRTATLLDFGLEQSTLTAMFKRHAAMFGYSLWYARLVLWTYRT